MQIKFEKAKPQHKEMIFSWLEEPHVKEFWDTSKAHKADIINFLEGRKTPSDYCGGHYVYWIARLDNHPYAMIMSIEEKNTGEINQIKIDNLSKIGNSYSLDYMIGDKNYIGKGLGARTLEEFIDFVRAEYDKEAVTFLIDPATDNPRAKHVYEKAGFEYIGDFIMEGSVSGKGKPHNLLKKSFLLLNDIVIDKALEKDIPNMNKLSYEKRRNYEKAQPMFWRYAGNKGEEIQRDWFKELLKDERHIILVAKQKDQFLGFVIGKLVPAPEVYDPGGLTCMIDDFCVKEEYMLKCVGGALIDEIRKRAKAKGASQILVVSGNHDIKKKKFLEKLGLNIASDWYVGAI